MYLKFTRGILSFAQIATDIAFTRNNVGAEIFVLIRQVLGCRGGRQLPATCYNQSSTEETSG